MGLHSIPRGLDLPLLGAPEQRIEASGHPRKVAVVAADYPGMRPTMHVQEGDAVRTGQLLFEDKKTEGVRFTSPGTGVVTAVNRGAKRALQSVVVQLDANDRGEDSVSFASFRDKHPSSLSRDEVKELLVESGDWVALRARPFGKVADPATSPSSIIVAAWDSNPHAPDLALALQGRGSDLERGLQALTRLTDGPVYVCRHADSNIVVPTSGQIRDEEFSGKHPAGTAGVFIHTLDPVNRSKLVWSIGLQDVLAIGSLFGDGKLDVSRVVSLAGPSVRNPRLLRTRLGASLDALTSSELEPDHEHRVIAGSVLSGRAAQGDIHGYLGRYDNQISVIREGREREFMGWLGPGIDKFSVVPLFLSKLIPGKKFDISTSTQGSHRAIVPIGNHEKVMAMDILPSFLLKALVMGDVEKAEELGVLELVEEDLALQTFVCTSKTDFAPYLRDTLTILEKEG